MTYPLERVLFTLAAALVMLLIAPWHLNWWLVDLVLGALIFLFQWVKFGEPTVRGACIALASSGALHLLGFLIAANFGISLGQLATDDSFVRPIRIVPDLAAALLSYSLLAGARALILRHRGNATTGAHGS